MLGLHSMKTISVVKYKISSACFPKQQVNYKRINSDLNRFVIPTTRATLPTLKLNQHLSFSTYNHKNNNNNKSNNHYRFDGKNGLFFGFGSFK
mmetsp:Transcript_14644/g.20404  ORF Transcript_14644/g.20404 Transcript_14644/m.20404 type:complete len:93 (-) Transcript_14644:2192-2470(-)